MGGSDGGGHFTWLPRNERRRAALLIKSTASPCLTPRRRNVPAHANELGGRGAGRGGSTRSPAEGGDGAPERPERAAAPAGPICFGELGGKKMLLMM